jgi:hypothetical protein
MIGSREGKAGIMHGQSPLLQIEEAARAAKIVQEVPVDMEESSVTA